MAWRFNIFTGTLDYYEPAAAVAAHAATHVTGGGDTVAGAIAAGNAGLMTGADKTKLDGIEALADVTGSNAPQAHAASHQDAGGDEISVAGLSGLLADDQHVLDAEVLAVAAAKGANADITSMTGLSDKGIPEAKVIHTRVVVVKVIADDTALATGDGKAYFTVPVELNGMNLISVGAHVYTVSSSGTPTFQIHNLTDAQDMLSTLLTIDANEKDSKDAATPAVINTTYDDVATGDELRFDCDVAGTSTTGMEIRMGFATP